MLLTNDQESEVLDLHGGCSLFSTVALGVIKATSFKVVPVCVMPVVYMILVKWWLERRASVVVVGIITVLLTRVPWLLAVVGRTTGGSIKHPKGHQAGSSVDRLENRKSTMT